ncbi:Uncharacterised protein [uncultured archaeon]|nr:Uncharacterised protein [uncultured archaeon]
MIIPIVQKLIHSKESLDAEIKGLEKNGLDGLKSYLRPDKVEGLISLLKDKRGYAAVKNVLTGSNEYNPEWGFSDRLGSLFWKEEKKGGKTVFAGDEGAVKALAKLLETNEGKELLSDLLSVKGYTYELVRIAKDNGVFLNGLVGSTGPIVECMVNATRLPLQKVRKTGGDLIEESLNLGRDPSEGRVSFFNETEIGVAKDFWTEMLRKGADPKRAYKSLHEDVKEKITHNREEVYSNALIQVLASDESGFSALMEKKDGAVYFVRALSLDGILNLWDTEEGKTLARGLLSTEKGRKFVVDTIYSAAEEYLPLIAKTIGQGFVKKMIARELERCVAQKTSG